jgi:hypothetical protein
MISKVSVSLGAAIALLVLSGCGDDADSAVTSPGVTVPPEATQDPAPPESAAPEANAPTAASVLFSDELADDRNMWGEVDDPTHGTAKFVDGDYVWDFRGSVAHWLPGVLIEQFDDGTLRIPDAAVSATLTIESGDGVAGVFCREAADTDAEFQWYEFVVRDGFAAIRLADSEGNVEPLAESRDVSAVAGQPVTMVATCRDNADGQAELALALDGEIVAETVVDDPLPTGGLPGMQAWTFPVHEPMGIRWHRFEVSALAER